MQKGRWLLVGLILNLGLAASSAVFLAQAPPEPRGDFVPFYAVWGIARGGEGHRLYDHGLQGERQRALLGGWSFHGGVLPFVYPPHVGLAFAPVSALPLRPAFLLWTLGQVGLLGWLMRILARLTRGQPALERWLTCATVLALPALLLTLTQGAFSLLLLVVVLKVYETLSAGRERATGLWLALGTAKPQLALLPALATAAARRWRAVAALAAAMLVVFVACAAAFGPRIWLDFLAEVLQTGRALDAQDVHVSGTINLKGALVFAFGPAVEAVVPAVGLAGWLLAAAATGWLWRGAWRPEQPDFALRWATTLLLSTFFNLHLYQQDGLQIFAAALLFDVYLRRSGRPRTGMFLLAALGPALWLLAELAFTPRWVRVPVVLELVLGGWMLAEWRRLRPSKTIGSGEASPPEPFMQTS